jgi:hypothetical protein
MATDKKDGRAQAEARFEKAQRTTEVAKSIIDVERDATRKKTERLRKLRLAQAASGEAAPSAKKPAGKKGRSKGS